MSLVVSDKIVECAIEYAISAIEKKETKEEQKDRKREKIVYSEFSQMHAFSGDNIGASMPNLEGKDVLVVNSSGDYKYNATVRGARRVDTFDINYNSLWYTDLKSSLIKPLNLKELYGFLCVYDNPSVFSKDVYNEIKHPLPSYSRYFWDELYKRYSGERIRKSELFLEKAGAMCYVIDNNLYLNEENYPILQSRIGNIESDFIPSNISELPSKLTRKYDCMYFSDIASFIEHVYPNRPLEQFSHLISNELSKYLNDNGEIYAAYLPYYVRGYGVKVNGIINNDYERNKVFTNPPYETRCFPYYKNQYDYDPFDDDLRQDAVLVYKKK